MGIIDLFSDANEKEAASVVDKGYKQGYKGAKQDLNQGLQGLKTDYASALRALEAGTAGASNSINANRDAGINAVYQGSSLGAGAITDGRDASERAVIAARDAALGEYAGYGDSGTAAGGLYSDALGLGGGVGRTRAESAFRTSPGYAFRLNEGLDAIDRRAASRGMLASGNTLLDTAAYAGGLADQEYGTWLDRLMGERDFGFNAAGARSGIRTNAGGQLADIYGNAGAGLADVYGNAGSQVGGMYDAAGARLADVNMTGGAQRGAVLTGRGDVKMGVGERLADLGYATRLGRAGVNAEYLAGKDNTGANVVGTIAGAGSLGAKLLGGGRETAV